MKHLLFLTMICLLIAPKAVALTSVPDTTYKDIAISFELSQAAANNSIIISGAFPIKLSQVLDNDTYILTIETPTIEFQNDNIVINSNLTVTKNNIVLYSILIRPQAYLNYSISSEEIIAKINSFPQYINQNYGYIDEEIRTMIIDSFQNLNLTIYPLKVLDVINGTVPNSLPIDVTNVTLNVKSLSQKLKIDFVFTIAVSAPKLTIEYKRLNGLKIKITTNADVTIRAIQFYTVGAEQIKQDYAQKISKGNSYEFSASNFSTMASVSTGRTLRIIFDTSSSGRISAIYDAVSLDRTEYKRLFLFSQD